MTEQGTKSHKAKDSDLADSLKGLEIDDKSTKEQKSTTESSVLAPMKSKPQLPSASKIKIASWNISRFRNKNVNCIADTIKHEGFHVVALQGELDLDSARDLQQLLGEGWSISRTGGTTGRVYQGRDEYGIFLYSDVVSIIDYPEILRTPRELRFTRQPVRGSFKTSNGWTFTIISVNLISTAGKRIDNEANEAEFQAISPAVAALGINHDMIILGNFGRYKSAINVRQANAIVEYNNVIDAQTFTNTLRNVRKCGILIDGNLYRRRNGSGSPDILVDGGIDRNNVSASCPIYAEFQL